MSASHGQGRRALWTKRWPDHPSLRACATLVVPFQDADPTGVVWHGNYFRYYETARTALLERLGFSYRQLGARGQLWPIVDSRVRFRGSLSYGEKIAAFAQIVEWEFRLRIYYELRRDDGELVNEAYTVQVPVAERSENLLVGTPRFLRDRIAELIEQDA